MSLSQDSAATIVCREVFDETSHPSNEEVVDYAKRLGIDPDGEPHLLDLAKEGLMAALPKGWAPCFHEATGAWYYYQAATGTTTWEHPLDAVYKNLVEQARTGNRQMSIEEDSKTTAKDLESHEEATLPKESIKSSPPQPKIPPKLVPLRKGGSESQGARKKEYKVEKSPIKREKEQKFANASSSSGDKAARDYTNLRFQDPKFYESPKSLDAPQEMKVESSRNELDLKEVLKRSESLSPRYEKDWEQLSSKFGSEENIIDIDKLSVNSLTKSELFTEKLDKEKQPKQPGEQKELTLSGGGFMFLKSNKSRDTSPRSEEFRGLTNAEELNNVVGERPKSILREKAYEDDERPTVDEERKSVRFDLEKEIAIKFTYSGSEDDWDTESEEQNVQISATVTSKIIGSSFFLQRRSDATFGFNAENYNSVVREEARWPRAAIEQRFITENNKTHAQRNGDEDVDGNKISPKQPKVVVKRFVVENVSENDHLSQTTKEKSDSTEGSGIHSSNKFENAKSVDMLPKSENDSTARSTDSKSSILDEIRKSKEIMLENMKKSDIRAKREIQHEKDEMYHLMKIKHDLEAARYEREHDGRPELELFSKRFEDVKLRMNKEHETEIQLLKQDFDVRLNQTRKELEENLTEQKVSLMRNTEEKLAEIKEEMAEREKLEIKKLITEMDKLRVENLGKVRTELEICYEKERHEILANLKTELDKKKKELLEHRGREMEKLESEYKRSLNEEKAAKLTEFELTRQHSEKIEALKSDLERKFGELRTELRMQQREKVSKVTEEHEVCLAEILRDFRTDEDLARKEYKQRLEEIRAEFSRDIEKELRKQNEHLARQENIDFEKIRCEKRLLEDKYNTLKEKYLKLKKDVRLAVERRSKKKEGNATASETEKSTSARTRTESTDQKGPPKMTPSIAKLSENPNQNQNGAEGNEVQKSAGFYNASTTFQKCVQKFESDDCTTTASETNSNMLKKKKIFTKKVTTSKFNNNVENPVENIRKQLEKLEDLGDQLPSNDTAYTLRYPFQDKAPVNASSELDFFRHRIHVERDSVRRAREALRQQRSAFQGRQRAWKQRSARATLEQLVQEERELSDMEVSLHRTRSLLGEKVIHLRHLEQSLERVANVKRNKNESVMKNDELTLSDVSSASSGFSSTDLGTDTFIDKPDHYQESTEIIASLENLNSEVREIWDVLNKRQDNNIPPPPTLMYLDRGWLPYQHLTTQPNNVPAAFGTPNIQSNILSQLTVAHPPTTTTQNIIAQYGPTSGYTTSVGTVERTTTNLIERTRNLRDWLRQARVESTDLVSPGQATL